MNKIAVFAGAGISKEKPASLPSWWDYNKCVLEALQQEASKFFVTDAPFYSSEQMLEELPVTSISDVLFKCGLGEVYFSMVSCLEGTQPNINHFLLANMALNGYLACVVTTNFDTLIEQAFDELGVPYKVLTEEEDYIVDVSGRICLIVKLHGSVGSKDSLIDTVTQKMKGLSERKKDLLRAILREYPSYVIGMSGEDLRFDLDYFQFISSNTDQNITWVKHPKGRLSPKVDQLKNRTNLLIVEDEIQTVFHDYMTTLTKPSICLCDDGTPIDISEKISEIVKSVQVGPYVCMGIVLLLLCDAGDTIQATHICQVIIDDINKNPDRFYNPFMSPITPLLHNMGVVLLQTGNIELAMQTIQRGVSLQEYNHDFISKNVLTNSAVLESLDSNPIFSVEKFEEEFHRNVGYDYINLGVCYLKRRRDGDIEKAKEYYQKALNEFDDARDIEGVNLAVSSLSEVNFNQESFDIFHNSEEEYNQQVNKYSQTLSFAKEQGDFDTYVTVSCLLAKLFMEYGEYGSADREILSLKEYMEINISVASKVRYHEIKAELYIRHNMEAKCKEEINEGFLLIEKNGNDIYLRRNLCLCEVRLLGHSFESLEFTKKCLAFLKESQNNQSIDRYYEVIPIDEALSLVNEKKTLYQYPLFYDMGHNYLKEKSKAIRAAIVRATFCNDEEMLVLLFSQLVSECSKKIDWRDVCRICFAYVEASKRINEGIYKYESTYSLICFLQKSGLDEDGSLSLQYIDDVLKCDDLDDSENNEIVGRLYASKAHRLLHRREFSESDKNFVLAREKLCDDIHLWQIIVEERVDLMILQECQEMILGTLQLAYPNRSEEDIDELYQMISIHTETFSKPLRCLDSYRQLHN